MRSTAYLMFPKPGSSAMREPNEAHRRRKEAINAEAEGAYMCVLEELTARQREAVRRYMATQTAADNDQVDNAYIAGIRDGIRFMISFRLADNR